MLLYDRAIHGAVVSGLKRAGQKNQEDQSRHSRVKAKGGRLRAEGRRQRAKG
jgi:hypothetical protein